VFELLSTRIRDRSENPYVRGSCMFSLTILFRARSVPVLIEQIDDRSYSAKAAIQYLADLRSDAAPSVPALLKALDTRDDLRADIARTLGFIRCADSSAAVDRLVRLVVAGRLDGIGIDNAISRIAPENMPALIEGIRRAEGNNLALLQRAMNDTTGQFRNDDSAAIFAMARGLCDESRKVRSRVAGARICYRCVDVKEGAELDAAIACLARALKDDDPKVRVTAATMINMLRGPTSSAIPALAEALGDSDATVRRAAADALGDMSSVPDAVETALKRLKDSDPDDIAKRSADFAILKLHGNYPTIDYFRRYEKPPY